MIDFVELQRRQRELEEQRGVKALAELARHVAPGERPDRRQSLPQSKS